MCNELSTIRLRYLAFHGGPSDLNLCFKWTLTTIPTKN
ncbi:hypothetical protein BOH78_5019 [Pichia kudriavzevii]|uniref:Uncharacterized protein n=1 Tax=Pichia kudriavzevii TaxID=4909 RepID=A0A099NJ65_PICKU|nr:hypothetical protein JL09_g6773 [Pichia kudriavzevii]ONH69278.1 hypothetical protein BOH78_5425 [Pichia kudriavzevii]ONH70719.1 hypothetical protein BOH78_5019 [Pichia kudriavzevii]